MARPYGPGPDRSGAEARHDLRGADDVDRARGRRTRTFGADNVVRVSEITRPPLTACFAGGGAFGYGFHMGVADGMGAAGIDIARFPMVGTSAGSHAAASLGSGRTFDEIADLWADQVAATPPRFAADGEPFVIPMYGDRQADDVAAVAVRVLGWRRRSFHSTEHSLTDLVAASSALPPILRPHRIDGKRYIDGGAVSMASADLAPAADLLLLLTPFSRRDQGIAGRIGGWQAKRETRKWEQRHGGEVVHVRPTAEMAALGGRRLREVVDMSIGRAVYPMAVELGREVAAEIRSRRPDLAAA